MSSPNSSQPVSFGYLENIARNLIFIDGVTRAGKSMLTNIIPSLENVEHIQFATLLECFLAAFALGRADENYTRALIRIYLNELAYNVRLGRRVNFRYEDQSGIHNYKEPKLYFERLSRPEGDGIVAELRSDNRYLPFQTHDFLVCLQHLNRLDLDYRMIEIFRHPVDVVHSWWKRGWGDRFGSDPRAFTLTIEWKGKQLPWYCHGYEEEWLAMNPMERCLRIVLDLTDRSVEQCKHRSGKVRIHLMTFEDFAEHPKEELKKICGFLKTEPTETTDAFILKARCPRIIDLGERKRKLDEIRSLVRRDLFETLIVASESFEKNLYGLRAADETLQRHAKVGAAKW